MKPYITQLTGATLFIFLLLTGLQSAQAQNKTWGFGPEIGLGLSLYGGDLANQRFNTGLLGGLHITYSTQPTFGVTLKALYHQRGSKQEINNVVNKQALDYLEFPLIARYFLTPGGKFRPNIFVGPTAGFLLGVRNKTGDGDYTNVSAEQRDTFRSFELGLTAGIGLNYLIAKETRLLFDTRYIHGLSDVTKVEEFSVYNRGIAFSLGLSFGITKKPLD